MTDTHRISPNALRVRRMGIDTYQEPVVYMRADCHICRSEGFEAQSRITIRHQERSIIATLNVVHDQQLLEIDEAGLSEAAWRLLRPDAGERVVLSHPAPLESLSHVRAKVYGQRLGDIEMAAIVGDIAAGRYADIHLSAFITACAGSRLDLAETTALTRAMIDVGDRLT
jgi:thymidine phosphorylase